MTFIYYVWWIRKTRWCLRTNPEDLWKQTENDTKDYVWILLSGITIINNHSLYYSVLRKDRTGRWLHHQEYENIPTLAFYGANYADFVHRLKRIVNIAKIRKVFQNAIFMFFIYNFSLFCFSPHYIHLHTHKTAYKEKSIIRLLSCQE